ncbi:hypothetical protein CHLNCDRAFT_135160 [Chlorella variabilis]|uniref:NAD-dependent epimerase/dehydratase domain-containing protein n=1 Tax=Chlorella variabilis TaxID=554065 RepID=E1ZHM0_CHLVA|nr:hypothetical protein CHLNCDRAFT_135160 [Chlorella variabilis]EFN54626.1 hypothetical protein CHLNCDRAFT_135160 [Chlorella variabilis]|eukprot:XP_005846728.1 hypothetical protein CHLNCDRAFT_135160 [Chlorella variabilis]
MARGEGQVNLDRILARKPLYPAERQAAPATVCVTGGAGYIGSRIVARLLAAGHTVHATRRAIGDDDAAIEALQALPGAKQRLRWFEADLKQAGSFDPAVAGCRYVIHAAGVVSLNAPKKVAYSHVIEPTLRGIENVLSAVNKTASVEKVVLTSSLAAISAEFTERGPGHVYTEADWTTNFCDLEEPYVTSKALAEWQAWAIASQQDHWRLVAICPSHVYGPPLTANLKCAPVATIKNLLDGTWWPFTAPTGLGMVDLDDVAAAHALAMVLPEAQGRYVLCERFALIYRWVKTMWRQRAEVDCSKARSELGLSFIPLEQSLRDFAERLIELGVLPRLPAAGGAVAAKSKKAA